MPRASVLAAVATVILASAGPSAGETTWLCGLSEDLVRLVCVADQGPLQPAHDASVTTAAVRGTRFPLDPGQRWEVDLWSPPTELARVELLARATICYRTPDCSVVMSWSFDRMPRAQPVAQALARR